MSLFEFEGLSSQGVIAVLNNAGELVERYTIPTGPQITGIGLAELNDSTFPDSLLITEGKKLHRVSLKKIISESKLS